MTRQILPTSRLLNKLQQLSDIFMGTVAKFQPASLKYFNSEIKDGKRYPEISHHS